jgi:ABC-type branched-subunit amino acid transport system substrate-binding protein
MNNRWIPRGLAPGVVVAALLLGACSTKTDDAATGGATGSGESALQTGPGVTDSTITLGVLTDQSGPFAGAATGIAQGRQLFWDQQNAAGGVCDRTVEFVVRDHGYNAQNAVAAYTEIKDQVLALDELLGSPMIAALLPELERDELLTLAVSFSSSVLDNPYVVMTGTTYDIEMMNSIQWLVDEQGLSEGDPIGHIYLEGDYGENALAGTRVAADELGLEVVEQKVQPTDTDLTAQVTALEAAGVSHVLLTTTPPQAASAVAVAEAGGYDATFVGSNPTFSPGLLGGPARGALENRYYTVTSVAPFASDAVTASPLADEFDTAFPGQTATAYVGYGYAQGQIAAAILQAACDNGALTRAGLLEAFQGLGEVDTGGLVAPIDYSTPGEPPARETYIARPDASATGGLQVVADLFASPLAESFTRTGT